MWLIVKSCIYLPASAPKIIFLGGTYLSILESQ